MKDTFRTMSWLAIAAMVSTGFVYAPSPEAPTEAPGDRSWNIQAGDVSVIGGYGDNFAYDGENVRELRGSAEMTLNADEGMGRLEITLHTTPESGPIQFSADRAWEGEIRIVQTLNTSEMDMARIAEEVWLHGDTGNEAPVMPKLFNYFATWGPSKIFVNGEEVVPMIGSHTMLSEQAREDGKITRNGEVYSPRLSDKTGFTNPEEVEFHYVAHTTQPDQNNFPPHTAWIHLHFDDVEISQKPEGVMIPYASEDMEP